MASRGVNKVIIVGNLGQEPEVKYMPNGNAVCNVTVATSESWKDKQTGEQKEVTEWHRVVAFRRLAEIMGEYLHKGSKVYIEGSLKTRKWQDNNGQDRYTTEIVAAEMQMLDSRSGGSANYGQSQVEPQVNQGYAQPQQSAPQQPVQQQYGQQQQQQSGYTQQQPAQQPPQQAAPAPVDGGFPNDFDDEIPF